VIVARITDHNTRRFDPIGSSWCEWLPRTDSPAWDTYLASLAAAADERTAQLGREAAEQLPAWAIETLGSVPTDAANRAKWERRAGIVASHRELRGHTDDTDALGRPPATGRQTEAYAAYRAGWDALGRPQVEHEMSNGQHRVRIRLAARTRHRFSLCRQRLAGTRQAAAPRHQSATLRAVEADQVADAAERARLRQEAVDARALAQTLDSRVSELKALGAA
jgi:hypothetical protein